MTMLKTAFLLTGNAGTLSQEVALIDKLIEKKKIVFDEKQTFLSSLGSGSFNTAAINACFRKRNPVSWEQYKTDFVFTLNNSNTVLKTHPAYWDTIPLRKSFHAFLFRSKLNQYSDLPFRTKILTFSRDLHKTLWTDSEKNRTANTLLIDLLMASFSVPVLYPSQYINGANQLPTGLPDGSFTDGATDAIFKKSKRHLKKVVSDNGPFEKMYIISPMRNTNASFIHANLTAHATREEIDILNHFFESVSKKGFLKFLYKLKKANRYNRIAEKIFVCVPELKQAHDILDFDNQFEKYQEVCAWADKNPNDLRIELTEYLAMFGL
jgi:hypothetical protein